MSQAPDRIPVPTNGKGPHPAEPPADTEAMDEAESQPGTSVVFTPTQLAVGFGILASLALLVVGRMRRNRSRSGGIFGRR
jgi:hypothetical protein